MLKSNASRHRYAKSTFRLACLSAEEEQQLKEQALSLRKDNSSSQDKTFKRTGDTGEQGSPAPAAKVAPAAKAAPAAENKPVAAAPSTGASAVNKTTTSASTTTTATTTTVSRSQKVVSREAKHSSSTSSPASGGENRPRVCLPANMEPTYFIGGSNGVTLIEETMNGLGYKRIKDKHDDTYKFKWCELKGAINYHTFREGEQMVNHIPNCQLLTNKLGLLTSLQEYDRVCVMVKRKPSRLDFIPETYKLDDKNERDAFMESFKEGDFWICKPTGKNQGKGIFLVRDLEELTQVIRDNEEVNQGLKDHGKPQRPLNRIIQRYIPNPLLLEGRKFDIRAYMLIANTNPYLVLYHKGYVRLCMYEYEMDASNLTAHLTNQYIQKKDPKYKEAKEDTAWSMDRFNDYVNQKIAPVKGLEQDWVYGTLTNRMKQIMTFCFNAVKHKLQCKVGFSDLYGLDFMVDDEMKVWLIEVNVNPCLATNCEALRDVIPHVVKETIHLSIECFDKSRKMRPLMPLQALKNFQIIYNGSPRASTGSVRPSYRSTTATPSKGTAPSPASNQTPSQKTEEHRSKSISPVRRSRSLSPVKEAAENNNKTGSTKAKAAPTTVPVHRHVLKATPTLISPSQTATKPQERLAGSLNGQVVKPLREKTLGIYKQGIIRTITRDSKPPERSPNTGKRLATGKSNNQDKVKVNPKGVGSQNTSTSGSISTNNGSKQQDTAAPQSNSATKIETTNPDTRNTTGSITEETSNSSNTPISTNGASSANTDKKPEKLTKEKGSLQRETTTVTLKMTHGSSVQKQKLQPLTGKADEQPNRGS